MQNLFWLFFLFYLLSILVHSGGLNVGAGVAQDARLHHQARLRLGEVLEQVRQERGTVVNDGDDVDGEAGG